MENITMLNQIFAGLVVGLVGRTELDKEPEAPENEKENLAMVRQSLVSLWGQYLDLVPLSVLVEILGDEEEKFQRKLEHINGLFLSLDSADGGEDAARLLPILVSFQVLCMEN